MFGAMLNCSLGSMAIFVGILTIFLGSWVTGGCAIAIGVFNLFIVYDYCRRGK